MTPVGVYHLCLKRRPYIYQLILLPDLNYALTAQIMLIQESNYAPNGVKLCPVTQISPLVGQLKMLILYGSHVIHQRVYPYMCLGSLLAVSIMDSYAPI